MPIVLASSSVYRRGLLARLGLPFSVFAPDIDEHPAMDERPEQIALRLSIAKAHAAASINPKALIVGSDQVAILDGVQLGKPGNFDNALRQLRAASGRTVDFHTGLCLYNSDSGNMQGEVVRNSVAFRSFDDAEIGRYLHREAPYYCAGSAKTEGLGIALIQRISGDDPNALIGLPLIALVGMLQNEGVLVI
ncbi:MAG: Maf family nucleotide pyrophosphatase [Pseudomonadota bacterium]|nr:Maf family nucleotide pyrophosphatase [Pseudomonadota bacterium]